MRKRSKYRPKGVRLDTMGYIKESMAPLASAGDAITVLRIKNHGALAAVCKGQATRSDVDVIIAAMNIAEALTKQQIGQDYSVEIRAGQDALYSMAARGKQRDNVFVFRAEELNAINLAMDVHDAQLEITTIQNLERALAYVTRVVRSGGARAIE